MTKEQEIEGTAKAALALAEYIFMVLRREGIIEATEANLWLERGISLNRKGTEPHQRMASVFESLRQGLYPLGSTPPDIE
jgi:hypothetical protein